MKVSLHRRDLWRVALLTGLIGACDPSSEPRPDAPQGVPVDAVHDDWRPSPGPSTGLSVPGAAPRRLSVPQLERSLEVIGGFPKGSVQLPDNLTFALGQPDFLSVTEPARDPSPLFMKFMVDLAGFICGRILEADRMRPREQRVLSAHDDVDANLRAVWFRFTGLSGPEADSDVDRLRATFERATASTDDNPDAGRVAVCMAAATSPEFLLY